MQFSWLNKRVVESDEGYSIFVGGEWGDLHVEYSEADKHLLLKGEHIFDDAFEGQDFGFSFYPSWRTARWEPPYADEPISDADRLRIRNNVTNALAFMQGKAVFR
jgi:hypothetical protein